MSLPDFQPPEEHVFHLDRGVEIQGLPVVDEEGEEFFADVTNTQFDENGDLIGSVGLVSKYADFHATDRVKLPKKLIVRVGESIFSDDHPNRIKAAKITGLIGGVAVTGGAALITLKQLKKHKQ